MSLVNRRIPCPVLVGRAAEIEVLIELLDAARQGRGATVLLGGDAGIGKTRLCRELRRDATARGFRVIEGRCSSAEASVPYAPFLDALRFRLSRGEGAVAARMMGPLLERVAPLLPKAPPALERRGAGTPVGRPLEAIYRVVHRLSTLDPVLLILEDVQWADPTSCDLLHFLSRRISGDRMLVVATYRTDELPGRHPVRRLVATLARERVGTEILLRPLDVDEVGAQVAAIVGAPPGRDVAQAMWERTDGNPLFVEELLRSLADAGSLGPGDLAAAELRDVALPTTISETILACVEALGARAFEVLSVAAVIGRRTSFDLLTAVTGMAEEELLRVVEQLVSHQLLVEEGAPGQEAYAFRHLLTQEVLYGSIIARRRRLWHRRVAQALESGPPAELPRQYDALAYHSRLGGDAGRARKYELLAGDQAAELCAWRDAEAHYERVLESLESARDDAALEARVLEKLSEVTKWQSRTEDALRYAEEAVAVRRGLGDRRGAAVLQRRVGTLYAAHRREWDRARACYGEAIALLAGTPPSAERAGAATDLGRLYLARGDLHEAGRWLGEGLDLARRAADRSEEALALAGSGELAVRRGAVADGIAQLEGARALVSAGGVALERASCVHRAGVRALETAREHERALAWVAGAIAYAERHGVVGDGAVYRAYGAAVARRLGRFTSALPEAHAAVEELRSAHRPELGEALRILADLHRVRGDFETAATIYREARQLGEVDAEIGLALVALAEGRAPEAAQIMAAAVEHRHPEERLFALRVLPFLVEAYVRAGQCALADAVVPRLEAAVAASDYRAGRAALAYATGLVRRNTAALEEAAARWEALEQPLEAAWARLELAAVHLPGDRRSAAQLARGVLSVCERLGARRDAERARRLLRAAGVRPRPTGAPPAVDPRSKNALTPREREVLGQLVRGITNREIARSLGIAEKTVGIHVSHIFEKLGCSTRTQAVRHAITQGLVPIGGSAML